MKFKKNDIAYIVDKNSTETTYTKCVIDYAYRSKYNNNSIVINKYTVIIGEKLEYNNNTSVWYPSYDEKQLISLNEYRTAKLKKLSGKNISNFFPKKFFTFKIFRLFRKK